MTAAGADFENKIFSRQYVERIVSLIQERATFVADFILGFEGEFTKEALEGPLEEYIRSNEWPMGKVMNCLRLAMVGASNGLGIADIVTLIGKAEFAKRIEFIKATLC